MTSPRANAPRPAPATDGLSALDRDRASSLADEGGASASIVEAGDDLGFSESARPGFSGSRVAVVLLAASALGLLAAWGVLRRRGRS